MEKNEALNKVVTRFPPSPTGFLHIGRVRTALFNYLFARHNKGKFVFRIEDTDKERSKGEYEADIIEGLNWLGITYDNQKPPRQSERTNIYKANLKKLLDADLAYISKETEGEREEVVRFKNPNKIIKFNDLIRGEITFDTTDLKDFVIAKSPEEPLYHLAVVVDDMEMGVTHVLRGEDGISNTPRQILLQEALGFSRPQYAHIPLILAPDRSKLSGRHGAVSVRDYREQGYLPEAILNYLALLGWNPGSDQEIFSLEELVEKFDISKVQKGGAIFDIQKLNWLNRHYLKNLPVESRQKYLTEGALNHKIFSKIVENGLLAKIEPLLIDRITHSGEIPALLESGELDYFVFAPKLEATQLLWKQDLDKTNTAKRLQVLSEKLNQMTETDFKSNEKIKSAVWDFVLKEGKGQILWPMRVALSGREKSPDPFTLASILGKKETLKRLDSALKVLA